jgi:hypothetical protein
MDLNHARLPIPPRWQSELQCSGGRKAAVRKINLVILQACHRLSNAASIGYWCSAALYLGCRPERSRFSGVAKDLP